MSIMESSTEQERRNAARAKTLKKAMIAYDQGRCTMSCTILEFSADGARLRPQDAFWVPDSFVLHLPNGTRRHCDVVRKDRTDIAVQYSD
jgi:hypothetical protein